MLPSPKLGPLAAVLVRVAIALGVLAVVVVVVMVDRDGYTDTADGHVSVLDALYYATVTVSTTGYGDITPVSDVARLVNIVVITPLRILFLVILVGTTLEVLATRTREDWRLTRWRSRLREHTVVVGYGTKGRSAISTLLTAGYQRGQIIVVDSNSATAEEAAASGFVAVTGDATRASVLRRAAVEEARQIIVTTRRDDTSVLVTLTARQLNSRAMIAAAVRKAENGPLVRQSGADHVITSAEASGRLLGMSACRPNASRVLEDLLVQGTGLDLSERDVMPHEIGRLPHEAEDSVIAVVRDTKILNTAEAAQLTSADRLVIVECRRVSPNGTSAQERGRRRR